MTLTDEDLKELGISTFGARKKMLLTIQGELSFDFTQNKVGMEMEPLFGDHPTKSQLV